MHIYWYDAPESNQRQMEDQIVFESEKGQPAEPCAAYGRPLPAAALLSRGAGSAVRCLEPARRDPAPSPQITDST